MRRLLGTSKQYAPINSGDGDLHEQINQSRFRRNVYIILGLCCLFLGGVFLHNRAFHTSLGPLIEQVVDMESYVLHSQKEVREDIFELLHNISTVFEGKTDHVDIEKDLRVDDLGDTAEHKEYVLMKERNERLEDEIAWLVMRSNLGAEDPIKKAQYELEQQQSKTEHLASTLEAKAALLHKIQNLQKPATEQDSSTAVDIHDLENYLNQLEEELTERKQQLAETRQAYHVAAIEGRRVDEAMGHYMDDGPAIGRDIVSRGSNLTLSVEQFASEIRGLPDDWDKGPAPLLCYSLVNEDAFHPRPNGGKPLAVLAFLRWSQVCGRYILFSESMDNIPDRVTQPKPEGYGLTLGEDLVVLTPKKHSTPLKSWEKFAYAIMFMSQHMGCTEDDKPLNPLEGLASDTQKTPCLNLDSHEWFIHLDVQAYFFRANLYYLLNRLSKKHAADWLTVTDKKALDFRNQGEYLGLPNFSDHIAYNSGFFFLLSKASIDSLTTVFRQSKKRGFDSPIEPTCSWSKGHSHSFLPTCVDGCASHSDFATAQRLCEETEANSETDASCGGIISVSENSYQLRAGRTPQFLASTSETAFVMTCSAAQKTKVMKTDSSYPQACGITKEERFDQQLGLCLFDLNIFLRKTADMYGREAFATVNPYRIAEIENYPILEKYFDGRFNENFGTPQRHFSPFLVATYMGFEPPAISGCTATIFDRISVVSAAVADGRVVDMDRWDANQSPAIDLSHKHGIVLLEEQLEEIRLLLDLAEDQRHCA